MNSSYGAALLLLVLLLPGAFAAWGYERHVERYGRRLKDWLLQLAGFSAICLALGAWPLHWMVSGYWSDFAAGRTLPWPVYFAPVAYLAVPAALGWLFGTLMRHDDAMPAVRRHRVPGALKLSALWHRIRVRTAPRLRGSNRAPTAWDSLFEAREAGFIRCLLRSGRWVGGMYAEASPVTSYVGVEGSDQDIYIAHAAEFDQVTGALKRTDGEIAWLDGGILLRRSDIESLEFVPTATASWGGATDGQE